LAGGDAVRRFISTQGKLFFHDISLVAIEGMKQDAKRTMILFSVR
jgi:hypothetical protein